MRFSIWSLATMLSFTTVAHAQRNLSFQSKYDRFTLTLNGGRGQINGKAADLSSVKDLLSLFNKTLPDACPSFPRPPDLTLKDGDKVRSVYVNEGIVSDGKNCITISGEGLFYFPVHRDFLIGAKQGGLRLKSPLKVFQQGQKIFELKWSGDEWVSETPDVLLDWDFVRQLQSSLEKFTVRLRVQEGIGKDKPKVIVQSGSDSIEFYKVTSIMWAVKMPGTHWLVASDDWSFLRDFDRSQYEDRFAPEIRKVSAAMDKDSKMEALSKLETGWSRNLRDMYHKLALQESEDPTIRSMAIKRLKSKPALETAGVMVEILEKSTDDDIRDDAAVVLKLNNPKGPKWKSHDPPDERQRALDYWRSWWRQKKSAP